MRAALVLLAAAGCQGEYAISPIDVHPDQVTECAFVAVEGNAHLEEYDCNPVFLLDEGVTSTSFGHTDVLGHPFYQLWSFARSDGAPEASYATSPDGTEWLTDDAEMVWPADADAWDGGKVQRAEIAWDPVRQAQVMLYGGISADESVFGLGLATSVDSRTWALHPANPVMTFGGWAHAGVQYAWPLALDIDDDGTVAYLAGSTDGDTFGMWRLETDDPRAWLDAGTEVLPPARDGRFDDQGLLDASVVHLDGVQYMFYVGFGEWTVDGDVRTSANSFLGLATSDDEGRTWTRSDRDPLPVHRYQDGVVSAVAARAVGPRIHLWVTDYYPALDAMGVGYFVYTPDPEEE